MYQFASGQTDNKTWTKGEECQLFDDVFKSITLNYHT